MSRAKLVRGGEWVSVRNMMNKQFPAARFPCSRCRALRCKMVWYSIKTGEVRCKQCFTPPELWEAPA